MSRSFKFVKLVEARLRAPTVRRLDDACYRVEGRLDTTATLATVEIAIPRLFRDLKCAPPDAYCRERWMKTGPEWHNGPPMCWVLPDEWRDAMSWRGKPVRAIMEEGVEWLLNGTSNLINRHYVAHLEGLTSWPEEWEFWSHARAGIQEYRREKRLGTACRRRRTRRHS